MEDIPDLVVSHQNEYSVQDLVDRLTQFVAQKDLDAASDVLSCIAERADQLHQPQVDTILHIAQTFSASELLQQEVLSLMSKATLTLPHCVIDERFLNVIIQIFKSNNAILQKEALTMISKIFTTNDQEIQRGFMQLVNFRILTKTLIKMLKRSVGDVTMEDLLIAIFLKFTQFSFDTGHLVTRKGGHKPLRDIIIRNYNTENKLCDILGLLLGFSEDARNISFMVGDSIHVTVIDIINKTDKSYMAKTLAFNILKNMCISEYFIKKMIETGVMRCFIQHLKCDNFSNDDFNESTLMCLRFIAVVCCQLDEDESEKLLNVIYNVMTQYRDDITIQNTAQMTLVTILNTHQRLIYCIGEQPEQIPLSTFILGNILMHRKCPQTLASTYCLLYIVLENWEVQTALGSRNIHIALDSNMRYHQHEPVIWSLSYKVLERLCHQNSEITNKLLHYGFLNNICDLLNDTHVDECNIHMIDNAIIMLKRLYEQCSYSVKSNVTKHAAELVQNLWLDIYKFNEDLSEKCIECLLYMWGTSSIQTEAFNGLLALILDCMEIYVNNLRIQNGCLKLLQLFSSCEIPRSVVLLCSKLLQNCSTGQDHSEGDSRALKIILQEEVITLCYLLANRREELALWIAQSDVFMNLLDIYNKNKPKSIVNQLVYACINALSTYKHVKNLLLEKACSSGSIIGVSCMLTLGAYITDTGTESPLSHACRTKIPYIVEMLLEQPVSDLKTPLKIAMDIDSPDIVGVLIERLNDNLEGGSINCANLGLHDLQALWFEPLLQGLKICNEEVFENIRKEGESLANSVQYVGEELACCEAVPHTEHGSDNGSFIYVPRSDGDDSNSGDIYMEENLIGQRKDALPTGSDPQYEYKDKTSRRGSYGRLALCLSSFRESKRNSYRRRDWYHRSQSFVQLSEEDIQFKDDKAFTAVFHPNDPRILLDMRSVSEMKPQPRRDSNKDLGIRLSSSSENLLSAQGLRKSGSIMFSPSFLPTMPENQEMLKSTDMPEVSGMSRSVSVLSFGTTISCSTEMSDMDVNSPSRKQSPVCLREFHEFDLSNNQITKIDGLLQLGHAALYKLRHIQKLVVSNNKLTSIPDQMFLYLPALHEVDLSHNLIQTFPACLLKLQTIEKLDLSHNKIEDFELPSDSSSVKTLKELNLSENKLNMFPVSLCAILRGLKSLNLGSNQIMCLPKHVSLRKIETLDMSCNKIQVLGDAFCNNIVQIEALFLQNNNIEKLPATKVGMKLNKLSQLDLSSNLISENEDSALEFISSLARLKILKLSRNGLTSFCKTNQLRTTLLSELDLGNNNLTKFDLSGPVKVYSKLKKLNLGYNQLSQLPKEIGDLTSLCTIDISHNKRLTTLPDHMGKLNRLWQLRTEGLKLDIDSSLLQGRIRDLIGYLHERLKKSVEYNQLKLMVVGYGGRGKTSLIRGLVKQKQPSTSMPTVGIIIKDWRFRGGPFVSHTLRIWDFAGQEDFYSTHQCFMSDRALYMVVYNLNLGLSEIEHMKPWLQNIHARAPKCPVIIVGTHWDKVPKEDRSQLVYDVRSRIKHLCDGPGYPEVVGMVEVDCLHENSFLERLRGIIRDTITNHKVKGQPLIGHKVPASYVKLQDLLLKELISIKQPFPVITHKRLLAIVEKQNLDLDQEELKQAIRFLHTCGVILHYEDSTLKLDDFYFLDPEWLCRMMAQIVTVREINPCIGPNGILQKQDIDLLFTGKKIGEHRKYIFPPSLIPQYLVLLHKFEIALPLDEEHWLVPARLSSVRPNITFPDHHSKQLLRRVYSMNYIPAGLWSRLITRILIFVNLKAGTNITTSYWQEGVYVKYNSDDFFLIDSQKPNTIQITTSSTPLGARLLGEVVDHLDVLIDEWYPGLLEMLPTGKTLLSINVPCVKCDGDDAYFFSLDEIISKSDSTDFVTCPRQQTQISLKDLAPDVVLADIGEHYHIQRKDLNLQESESSVIGDGSLSRVYKAMYNYTLVAVKKFESTLETMGYKALRQEALILSKLNHLSLVKMVAVESQKKLLILELAPLGSLRKVLSDGLMLSSTIKHRIALQIVEGLEYLHRQMIIYRDMKPDNILVFSLSHTKAVNVKISDYGIACVATPYGGFQSQEGTPGYRAPEIINGENYNLKADMFSYGVTIYELITNGKHPYGELGSGYQLDENIAQGNQPEPMTSHILSPWNVMEDVIGQCLSVRPYNRPLPCDVISQLREIESLCSRQTVILSKQLQVDCVTPVIMPDDSENIMIACGGTDSSEITYINMEASATLQGSLFQYGRVLTMLYIVNKDGNLLMLGTVSGMIYIVDTATWSLRTTACNLGDSVLCITQVHGPDGIDYLLAGTAGGRVAIFIVQDIADDIVDPEVLQLGTPQEPVNCIYALKKPAVYITVATRIYRLRLHPKVMLETRYYFDTADSDEVGPISSIVKYMSNLHLIKRWGHKVYKVSVRGTPYIKKTFNTLHHFNKMGLDCTHPFDARLQSLCVVQSNLWLGTANGCLIVMDSSTYTPLTCLTRLGSQIRHLSWMPKTDDTGCVVMCFKNTVQGNTQQDIEACCISVWDDDLDIKDDALKQYLENRKMAVDNNGN